MIVGVVTDEKTWGRVNGYPCDLVELRYDCFKPSVDSILSCEKPIILTIRTIYDGGISTLDAQYRADEMCPLLKYVDYIDVDVESIEDSHMKRLISLAHENDVKVIVSSHWFVTVPSVDCISNIENDAKRAGGDILKVAFPTENEGDVLRGLEYLNVLKIPSFVMGVGKMGKESRKIFSDNGSKAIYGYCGETPPYEGMPSVFELRK